MSRKQRQPNEVPAPAIAFGHLKDGRYAVAELHTREGATVGGHLLCVSPSGQYAARAWLQCAYLRLCERREYSEAESAFNAKDVGAARLEDFSHGEACTLAPKGKQYAAAHAAVADGLITEPRLLCVSDRLTAWSTLSAWAAQHLLPRRPSR